MVWSTPKTWTDGEPVTAAALNTQIRDNLSDLNARSVTTVSADDVQFSVASGAEAVMVTHTIPANTLTINSDTLHLIAAGTFAANGNDKTVRIRLGTTGSPLTGVIVATIFASAVAVTQWWIEGHITRTALNVQSAFGFGKAFNTTTPQNSLHETTVVDGALTESSAMALVVTGDGISASDIVYERSVLKTYKQ